jgi:AcrR family transcriptional regulator
MGGSAANTRRRILEAAYELFYRKGFGRVGVDVVAEKARITKRTLYYHFDSKDQLLSAVLDFHHELARERIARWSERLSGDIDTLLDALLSDLANRAARPLWEGAGFTRLAMELADLPGHPARKIARRHKAAVEGWLAREFARQSIGNAEERARQIMLLLEGCLSLLSIHGDKRYIESAAIAAKYLVVG